ncbi:hypothetical protein LCGC14_2879480, partial [marine sediment metagenome]
LEIKQPIARLSEAGRHDEAEQLKREGHELMQQLKQRQQEGQGPAEELERRWRHVQVAAENLRAAGLHKEAEHLMRPVEQKLAEIGGHGDRQPGPPHHPDRPEGPPPDEVHRVVRELHGQMEQMRQEMQQLREQLHELLEREGR